MTDDATRCFDCFDDFQPGAARFAVLKKMRDLPADWRGDDIARAFAEALCFDMVQICQGCAGWYGDEAIVVAEAEEALKDARREVAIDTYFRLATEDQA